MLELLGIFGVIYYFSLAAAVVTGYIIFAQVIMFLSDKLEREEIDRTGEISVRNEMEIECCIKS